MNSNHQNPLTGCTVNRPAFGCAISGSVFKTLTVLGGSGTAAVKRLLPISVPLLAAIILIGASAGDAYAQAGRISGRAYLETDGSRGFTASVDAPMPGAPIRLCPAPDIECVYTPVRQTLTDAAGFYEFANLAAGSYSINFGIADATRYSVPVNDEKDPGVSYSQFIVGADADFTRDFVFDLGIPANTGSFTSYGGGRNAYYGGRIWNDANRNGLYEASEAKFAGVALSLFYDYNGDGIPDLPYTVATYISNAKGQFVLKFSGHTAAPGTYPVLICLNPENFNSGAALFGYQPTAFSTGDPNDQVDGDNNIAVATEFGFCTKTLNPLRGKLMPYGGSDRMTIADGAPRDAGNGLFDETIDLGLSVAPAGSAPASFGNKTISLPERGESRDATNNSIYGPTAESSENSPESSQTNDGSFFINRPSHEQGFGLFNRERVPNERAVNPALSRVQSVITGSGRALRIETSESGMFTISRATIASANFNPANQLRLFNNGREEPIIINADGSVIFFGRGLDTAGTNVRAYYLSDAFPSGALNAAPLRIPLAGTVKSRKRTRFFAAEEASKTESTAAELYQRQESVYETNTAYLTNVNNGAALDNFYSLLLTGQPASFAMEAPGIVAAPADGSRTYLTIEFIGVTTPLAYELQVYFNNQLTGTLPASGARQMVSTMEVPATLTRASNTITLKEPGGRVVAVKRAILSYNRPYAAADVPQQVFAVRKNTQVAVTGYRAGEAIRVFDISKFGATTELKVSLQPDSAIGAAFFNVPADTSADRKIVVVRAGAAASNDDGFFTPKQTSARSNGGLQVNASQLSADYLIIGPEEFAAPMERLCAYRAGQGVSGKVVNIADVYDEYAFGRAEPEALTEFLRDTQSWSVKPKFIFLAGNATFDPKNYLGSNVPNRIPTVIGRTGYGENSADDLMFNVAGNEVGDFYWGRFPARSAEMLDHYVSKIINYENASLSPNRPVLFFDDDNIEYNFDQTLAHFQSLLPAGTQSAKILKSGRPAPAVKNEVIDFINANHPKIINYAGHGATGQLSSSNIFDNKTVDQLTNRDELAFGIILACLSFGTENPFAVSVGESLVKAPGGIVAGIGSTALTGLPDQEDLVAAFYEQLKTNPNIPAGEALQKSKSIIYPNILQRSVVSTWVLIGDPLVRIR